MTVVKSLAVDKKVKTVNNFIIRVEDSKRIFSETAEKVDSYAVWKGRKEEENKEKKQMDGKADEQVMVRGKEEIRRLRSAG